MSGENEQTECGCETSFLRWRRDAREDAPRLIPTDGGKLDSRCLEYHLLQFDAWKKDDESVADDAAFVDASETRPNRRDVDSARPNRGSKTSRRFERWRHEKQEAFQKLQVEMDDLKKANAQLRIRQQTMEQQSDSLRAEISQLRSDKASAVLHAKTVEETSETREAGRIGLVAEQTEQLREALEEVRTLRGRLAELERQNAALKLLYCDETERVTRQEHDRKKLETQLDELQRELRTCQQRSSAWEEAIESLKKERDDAQSRCTELQKETASIHEELTRCQDGRQKDVAKLKAEIMSCQKREIDNQTLLSEAQRELNETRSALEEAAGRSATLQHQMDSLTENNASLTAQLEATESHVHSLVKHISQVQNENAEVKAALRGSGSHHYGTLTRKET